MMSGLMARVIQHEIDRGRVENLRAYELRSTALPSEGHNMKEINPGRENL
jgi:hypothetical protein